MHLPNLSRGSTYTVTILFILNILWLTACQSPESTVTESNVERPNYTFVAPIIEGDTPQALVERHHASVAVWMPETGRAIMTAHLRPRNVSADIKIESNQQALSIPVRMNGNAAWADGNAAWADGNAAWADGNAAWADGNAAWADGNAAWADGNAAWADGNAAWADGSPLWSKGVHRAFLAPNKRPWEQIYLPEAHANSKLGKDTIVAVLDTGVDINHKLLKNNLTPSYTWRDFVDNDQDPSESSSSSNQAGYGHGTAAAGIIVQVAPQTRILPLRVLASDGTGDTDNVAKAIKYAVDAQVDVINLSLSARVDSPTLNTMLTYAAHKGVYIAFSIGNTGDQTLTYPSANTPPNSLSVGSVDANNVKSTFSTYGPYLTLLAPGEKLLTSYPNNALIYATGTSFSTPIISGTLALGAAEGGNDIVTPMRTYATSVENISDNLPYTDNIGSGLVNVAAYLKHLSP